MLLPWKEFLILFVILLLTISAKCQDSIFQGSAAHLSPIHNPIKSDSTSLSQTGKSKFHALIYKLKLSHFKKPSVNIPTFDTLSKFPVNKPLSDSIPSNQFSALDSGKENSKNNSITTAGNLKAGYTYGLLPWSNTPGKYIGNYSIEGTAEVELVKIPFTVLLYHSGIRNSSGLNNNFRISFDATKYQENLERSKHELIQRTKNNLKNACLKYNEVCQKLYYIQSFASRAGTIGGSGFHFSPSISNDGLKINTPEINQNIINTQLKGIRETFKDSLPSITNIPDKKDLYQFADTTISANDSLISQYSEKIRSDSLQKQIRGLKQQMDASEKEIALLNKSISQLENLKDTSIKIPNQSPIKLNWLAKLHRLDIGMCTPNYSTFLINGGTIQGLNIEFENKKYFLAITHGITLNPFYTTAFTQINSSQPNSNVYNFFDFNNSKGNRRITVLKFGPGNLENTHLHFGISYSSGLKSNYITTVPTSSLTTSGKEHNYVIALDGKWKINSENNLEIALGKSSLRQLNSLNENSDQVYTDFMNVKERSYAALARYLTILPFTKTQVTISSKWIDPFFKSYGIGYMRSDIFRYEIKAEQNLGRKIKLMAFFRKDVDNLLKLYNYKATLKSLGLNLSLKVSKRFSVRAGYNPILNSYQSANSVKIKNRNNIRHALLSYTSRSKSKSSHSTINLIYTYYNLSNPVSNLHYQDICLNTSTQLGSHFNNILSLSSNYSECTDSLKLNSNFLSDQIRYTTKSNLSLMIGVNASTKSHLGSQLGYEFCVGIPIFKKTSIEFRFEKIIAGDLYSRNYPIPFNSDIYAGEFSLMYNW